VKYFGACGLNAVSNAFALRSHFTGEYIMAKGQMRTNKEAKKPKQDKTAKAPVTGGFSAPATPPKGKTK
jgi:hypothetical protein